MRLWIKDPLAILADDAERGIVIEGTRIVELVGRGQTPALPAAMFDASRHVVIPGLINTHHHFFQTLTRAHPSAINKPLFAWLQALYAVWQRLTPEALSLASRLAYVELLMSGCTTAADHHYVFPRGLETAIDLQVEAAASVGIRATLTRGSMDLSVEDGGLPPASVVQDPDKILDDSERVVRRFHDPRPGAMVQIALAPCSPFSCSSALMRDTLALAERLDCRLHTHLCETKDEELFCLERYGKRPTEFCDDIGWLNRRVWIAHGIHFNDAEIERLAQAGVAVAHCPTSNMILASGLCRTCDLEAAGVTVGLGVDGSASNDSSNLIETVRHGFLLSRLAYGADRMSHRDALRWATEGSARCLGRDDIGKIEVGREADLALYTLDDVRFSGAHDPLAAIVLCGATRADRVMVGGEWRVVDGQPIGIDVGALVDAHRRMAKDVFGG